MARFSRQLRGPSGLRRRFQGVAVRCFVLLVCGAFVNVLVAVFCAVSIGIGEWPDTGIELPAIERWDESGVIYGLVRRPGMLRILSLPSAADGRRPDTSEEYASALIFAELTGDEQRDRLKIPSWSLVAAGANRHSSSVRNANFEDARGWPFLSFRSSFRLTSTGHVDKQTAHGCLELSAADLPSRPFGSPLSGGMDDSAWAKPRVVPYLPIWSGLLLNSVFYGVVILLIWSVYHAVRRRISMFRGRCPQCHYRLYEGLEAGCPECGWNRPQ